jgi:hypothetical protein
MYDDTTIPPAKHAAAPSWRWLAVLLASILLHLCVLEWANGVIGIPNRNDEPIATVTVQLKQPMLPVASVEPTSQPARKPRVHRVPKPAPAAPAPVVDTAPRAVLTADTPTEVASTTSDTSGRNGAAADATPAPTPTPAKESEQTKADAPTEPPTQPHYKIDLPPSAKVKYDVKFVSDEASTYYGSGTIRWQRADDGYQVTGEVSMLIFTLLNFTSEGKLDEYGIAPVLFSEKKRTRSETNTHFNRDERNSISFSASKLSLPRKGGEQDRASVLWQLAGIGRGDQEKFVPGAQLDLFVAGDRDGDIWSILVIGQEEIETGAGKMTAWHVVRIPRPGSYDDKIDIWLAPQYEWSPVRIHYTYKKGGYLDMSMTSFQTLLAADTLANRAR